MAFQSPSQKDPLHKIISPTAVQVSNAQLGCREETRGTGASAAVPAAQSPAQCRGHSVWTSRGEAKGVTLCRKQPCAAKVHKGRCPAFRRTGCQLPARLSVCLLPQLINRQVAKDVLPLSASCSCRDLPAAALPQQDRIAQDRQTLAQRASAEPVPWSSPPGEGGAARAAARCHALQRWLQQLHHWEGEEGE